MHETEKNNYEYIDIDNIELYTPKEREMEYVEYLANKSRKEMDELREARLQDAIENNDIDYLKIVYQNVPTHELIKMLLGKIVNRILR